MSKELWWGLDLGSNSLGWAVISAEDGEPNDIIATGVRIFQKAVEDKTPTPKNQKRRERRLARRVIQRRARRKQRMLNYLISLDLLPIELKNNPEPEKILNSIGDPYSLRAKALDDELTEYELGRVFLHLVQRRGFLSNKKTLLGSEMLEDPDVISVLAADGDDDPENAIDSEESEFKADISELRKTIRESGSRTLGEYLSTLDRHTPKRNRVMGGGHMRTDRRMYQEEFEAIWKKQSSFHTKLTHDIQFALFEIIFFQRPLKLKEDRVGKCTLETKNKRIAAARLEYQRFRYLQDINNLSWRDPNTEKQINVTDEDREKLTHYFETTKGPTFGGIRKVLGLRKVEFNLETSVKKLKGNITACTIRSVFVGWDNLGDEKQLELVEDLLSIKKKTALKSRLINHWQFDIETAVRLCMLEFEPGHGNLSRKAICKLMPFLETGLIYSDARVEAGYGYEKEEISIVEKLPAPPQIANPIVNKGLHELRRVSNALIAEFGKPDVIRIEMARDLEMNTKRYKQFEKQQKENTKANDKATEEYQVIAKRNPKLGMSSYPSKEDKIKYRLWQDQDMRCAYSNKQINMTTLFSAEVEIDHILPFSQSLDDSYMNKVVCFASENREKGNRTPNDAFSDDIEKWEQITASISRWNKKLSGKVNKFFTKGDQLIDRDFIGSQLTDTRYISKEAGNYLATLGADITYTKGVITSWLRHHWQLNDLISNTNTKTREDHRHHAIDAVVIACVDRSFYQNLVSLSRELEKDQSNLIMNDLLTDPPFDDFKSKTQSLLNEMIISFQPQRKISGAFHEETGVGFIEGIGTVYRKNLDANFDLKWTKKIIDPSVKECIERHLNKFNNKPKEAFAKGIEVLHKDGKTPIKRVRILQAKTDLDSLEKTKFGARDKNGDVFRWMAYGNVHHLEIIKNKSTEKFKGYAVNTMEAASRVRGVNGKKTSMYGNEYDTNDEYQYSLHINDLVEIKDSDEIKIFRVQKIEQSGSLTLRLQTAANLNNKDEEIRKSVQTLINEFNMKPIKTNILGTRLSD